MPGNNTLSCINRGAKPILAAPQDRSPPWPRIPAPAATAIGPPPPPLTPAETARYTRDLLETLRRIALGQGQGLLAHLLGLAAMEAKHLGDQAQET